MTRRLLLLVPLAACFGADPEREVANLIASAAAGLSDGKPEVFLDIFDHSMPDFEKLRQWVTALTTQGEVTGSIEIRDNSGDDMERTLSLDWILRLDGKNGNPGYFNREKTVTCKFKKIAKKWKVVSIAPLDFFTPLGG